jgi:hypothetical protein
MLTPPLALLVSNLPGTLLELLLFNGNLTNIINCRLNGTFFCAVAYGVTLGQGFPSTKFRVDCASYTNQLTFDQPAIPFGFERFGKRATSATLQFVNSSYIVIAWSEKDDSSAYPSSEMSFYTLVNFADKTQPPFQAAPILNCQNGPRSYSNPILFSPISNASVIPVAVFAFDSANGGLASNGSIVISGIFKHYFTSIS